MKTMLAVLAGVFLVVLPARADQNACDYLSNDWATQVTWNRISEALKEKGARPSCKLNQRIQSYTPPADPNARETRSAPFKNGEIYYDYYTGTGSAEKGRQVVLYTCGGPAICTAPLGAGRPTSIPSQFDVIVFDYPGMGRNAHALDGVSNPTLDDVGEAIPAIVKAAGLQGSQGAGGAAGNYILYGVSFGTMVATIGGSKLGFAPPMSVLLDSAVDRPPSPASGPAPDLERVVKQGDPDQEKQKAFLEKYVRLLQDSLGRGNASKANVHQVLTSYFARLDPKIFRSMVSQGNRWTVEDVEGCVAEYAKNQAFSSPQDKQNRREQNKEMKVAYCGKQFDSADYQIPAQTAINYLVGTADKTTPYSMAAYHQRTQSICRNCSRVVSVMHGTDHGEFTVFPEKLGAKCLAAVWSSVFSQIAWNFSGACPSH